MENESGKKRRGGSLVVPILLILVGVLLLLDNLNIISGIDWATIWKFWPVVLIAIGLEIILGRRVSVGAIFLLVIIVIVGGIAAWGSVISDSGDRTTEQIVWPMNGAESAELELDIGVGELWVAGKGDLSDLLIAELDLASGADVKHGYETEADRVRGWILIDKPFSSIPSIFGGKANEWDVRLNEQVPWEMRINAGVGEARLDLSNLQVSDLRLDSGVGSVDVIMPRRGATQATIDGSLGDLHITIPEGTHARFRVDRGIGDLTVASRFKRRGDYYETEGFNRAESFIEMKVDIGLGSVTVR